MSWPWSQLGLPGPSDLSEVRHAYAEKLKTAHPEEDPEGFQRLHSAYQLASRMARQQKRGGQPAAPRTEPPPSPPPPQEDFAFGELLKVGGEPPSRPPEGEQDFDYDELLQEGDEPSRPPREEEKEPEFDFERLFAEGEAERAEARRRRGEARRRAQAQAQAWARERQRAKEWAQKREQWQRQEQRNTYDRERQDQFRREESHWQNTETILHTIEMMYNAQAGPEVWKKFFQSAMFQQNKNSLDLIFGLEDFVSSKSLPQEVRLALFLACGMDKGVSRPELRPLYQMLLPAWKAANYEKTHEWKLAALGVVLGLAFPFVFPPLLKLGVLPALALSLGAVWIFWVIRKAVKTGNQERRARGEKVSKKQERRSILLGAVCVAVLVGVMSWGRTRPDLNLRDLLPTRDPREQVCRYLEKDFGLEVASLYQMSEYYARETFSNVFYLEDHPNRQFLAGPDGDRDVKNGSPGYTTNLPEMMMLWSLRDFMYERKIYDVDTVDREEGLEHWETGSTFVITLPTDGAGELITSLGGLLEELSQEQWYQAQTPVCEVVLCSTPMMEGRLVLHRWHPSDGSFDAESVRALYETAFASSYCAQMIRELELDRDFIHETGEQYTLTNEGMAVILDHDCYKIFGLDESGAVAMEYYVSLKERNIYCLPGDFWETGNQEEQLNFYRLLHWGDSFGTVGLYYPWLRVN